MRSRPGRSFGRKKILSYFKVEQDGKISNRVEK